jgi:hypothetical protein
MTERRAALHPGNAVKQTAAFRSPVSRDTGALVEREKIEHGYGGSCGAENR